MNYKLMLPTYRTRQRYLHRWLSRALPGGAERGLSLGTGEGDYDAQIAAHCERLDACDINPDDIAHAAALNSDVAGLHYSVEDAQALSFDDDTFDVIVCLEVIEHVGDARALLAEMHRVLKPGGVALLTCPNHDFPWTYDPINAALRASGAERRVSIGAYGYGHSWLCQRDVVEGWLDRAGFDVTGFDGLSGALVGLCECYAPGLLQSALKANAGNDSGGEAKRTLRPGREAPPMVGITDALIKLDRALFGEGRSIGLAFSLRKRT